MTNTTTYTFDAAAGSAGPAPYDFHDSKVHGGGHRSGPRHRRGWTGSSSSINTGDLEGSGGGDQLSCSGSLTYSATSSVNSGCAESTDSSFGDIMKVLDAHDGKDLASLLRGGGGGSSRRLLGSERSLAGESLAYSTDADTYMRSLATEGESHMHGADFLSQANSTQPPDHEDHAAASGSSHADGGEGDDPFADNIFFAPAEHTESIKQRKERKRQERLQRKADSDQQKQQRKPSGSASQASASSSRGGGGRGGGYRPKGATGASFESSGSDLPDPAQLESRQGTPPGGPSLPPRGGDPRRAKSRSNSGGGGGRGASSQYSSAIFRDEDDYDGRRDGPAHGGGYGLGAGYRGNGSGGHHHHQRTSHPGKSFADYTLRECGEDIWYYARGWLFCFPAAKSAA